MCLINNTNYLVTSSISAYNLIYMECCMTISMTITRLSIALCIQFLLAVNCSLYAICTCGDLLFVYNCTWARSTLASPDNYIFISLHHCRVICDNVK